MQLDFCLFTLFIETSSSLLYVSEVGLVLSVSPVCEAKTETKAAIEHFDNYIFNLFPPQLGVHSVIYLGLVSYFGSLEL